MTAKTAARLIIDVSPDFRAELKIRAVAQGKTLKDYVQDTLTERIRKDGVAEDAIWAEMSESAKKEGSLSEEASDGLLGRMRSA